jgi:hypothetical protein
MGQIKASVVLVLSLVMMIAEAQNLSSVGIFDRCYSDMTRTPPAFNHPLRLQVLNGQISAVDACMEIFDKGRLGSDGMMINQNDLIAQKVVETFSAEHRLWFPSDNFGTALTGLGCGMVTIQNEDFMDSGEAALHFTRALLQSGIQAREILTGSGLRARRHLGTPTVTFNGMTSFDQGPKLVEHGRIIGVVPYAAGAYVPNIGGGVIGGQSNMMLNWGQKLGDWNSQFDSNGGLYVPRRWAKANIQNLLCRELPVIRVSDADAYVQPNSALSFRKGRSCMSCHATMDQMAYTARQYSIRAAGNAERCGGSEKSLRINRIVTTATKPSETAFPDNDADFTLRPAKGKLLLRSAIDGSLIDTAVEGPAALGMAMANTNDFYVCTAKHYLEFFLKNKISMVDPGVVSLSDEQKHYFNTAVELGMNLKQSQDLRSLIRSIFESAAYQKITLRDF